AAPGRLDSLRHADAEVGIGERRPDLVDGGLTGRRRLLGGHRVRRDRQELDPPVQPSLLEGAAAPPESRHAVALAGLDVGAVGRGARPVIAARWAITSLPRSVPAARTARGCALSTIPATPRAQAAGA